MEMNQEQLIAAHPDVVWAALNDPAILKAAIPGCESFEANGENSFNARITAKVGPVKAAFKFVVTLADINPPVSYTINGEGQGGAAGFANGSAAVSLQEQDGNTLLSYHAKAQVGGKLAQLGGRLIDGTANKLAGEFFTNFTALVAPADDSEEAEAVPGAESAAQQISQSAPTIPAWQWVLGVLLVAALIYSIYT